MFENISGTFQAQIPNFKIVNDTLQAIDDITDNSDVLLYNFSQFDHGKQDLKVFFEVLCDENLRLFTLRHYTKQSVAQFVHDKEVVLEQRSSNTLQLIVR